MLNGAKRYSFHQRPEFCQVTSDPYHHLYNKHPNILYPIVHHSSSIMVQTSRPRRQCVYHEGSVQLAVPTQAEVIRKQMKTVPKRGDAFIHRDLWSKNESCHKERVTAVQSFNAQPWQDKSKNGVHIRYTSRHGAKSELMSLHKLRPLHETPSQYLIYSIIHKAPLINGSIFEGCHLSYSVACYLRVTGQRMDRTIPADRCVSKARSGWQTCVHQIFSASLLVVE